MLESSVFSIMFTGQKNYPNILPRKDSSVKPFDFLVQNPSLCPNLALVNYKGLGQPATHPSNAISMATKGDAVEKSPDSKIKMPMLQVGWII